MSELEKILKATTVRHFSFQRVKGWDPIRSLSFFNEDISLHVNVMKNTPIVEVY